MKKLLSFLVVGLFLVTSLAMGCGEKEEVAPPQQKAILKQLSINEVQAQQVEKINFYLAKIKIKCYYLFK
jgi:predicted small lipoprotein YifL